jgi:hypothetical protein
MHQKFQVTSFVDNRSLLTFADGSLPSRNPRRGQWIKLAWLNKRSRFIGVTPAGALCIDHSSGGNFRKFSEKCKAFDRAHRKHRASKQLSFKFDTRA